MAELGREVNPGSEEDLVWIAEAAGEFEMGERTIYRMIKEGHLSSFKRDGDKRTYVSRAQLRDARSFREVRAKYDA